jgi:hypothetical protein
MDLKNAEDPSAESPAVKQVDQPKVRKLNQGRESLWRVFTLLNHIFLIIWVAGSFFGGAPYKFSGLILAVAVILLSFPRFDLLSTQTKAGIAFLGTSAALLLTALHNTDVSLLYILPVPVIWVLTLSGLLIYVAICVYSLFWSGRRKLALIFLLILLYPSLGLVTSVTGYFVDGSGPFNLAHLNSSPRFLSFLPWFLSPAFFFTIVVPLAAAVLFFRYALRVVFKPSITGRHYAGLFLGLGSVLILVAGFADLTHPNRAFTSLNASLSGSVPVDTLFWRGGEVYTSIGAPAEGGAPPAAVPAAQAPAQAEKAPAQPAVLPAAQTPPAEAAPAQPAVVPAPQTPPAEAAPAQPAAAPAVQTPPAEAAPAQSAAAPAVQTPPSEAAPAQPAVVPAGEAPPVEGAPAQTAVIPVGEATAAEKVPVPPVAAPAARTPQAEKAPAPPAVVPAPPAPVPVPDAAALTGEATLPDGAPAGPEIFDPTLDPAAASAPAETPAPAPETADAAKTTPAEPGGGSQVEPSGKSSAAPAPAAAGAAAEDSKAPADASPAPVKTEGAASEDVKIKLHHVQPGFSLGADNLNYYDKYSAPAPYAPNEPSPAEASADSPPAGESPGTPAEREDPTAATASAAPSSESPAPSSAETPELEYFKRLNEALMRQMNDLARVNRHLTEQQKQNLELINSLQERIGELERNNPAAAPK